MSIYKKLNRMSDEPGSSEQHLYTILTSENYYTRRYERRQLGEDMETVSTLFYNYWKPRYLLDHRAKCAYEFMDADARLIGVKDSDIAWESLRGLPDEYIERVRDRNAFYPSFIGRFENDFAIVKWQINPDGRYWMDEDGFGMTDDAEFNIYGVIDRQCRIVVPYRAIRNDDELGEMLRAARFLRG